MRFARLNEAVRFVNIRHKLPTAMKDFYTALSDKTVDYVILQGTALTTDEDY